MAFAVFTYTVKDDDRAVAIVPVEQIVRAITTAEGTTLLVCEGDLVAQNRRGNNVTTYVLPLDETLVQADSLDVALRSRDEQVEVLKERGTLSKIAFPPAPKPTEQPKKVHAEVVPGKRE